MKPATFLTAALLLSGTAWAQPTESLGTSKFVTTSDGVRIHCLEKGAGPSILFVPGWTMPAEIWEPQIVYFSKKCRVVAMDPRSQGRSSNSAEGNYPTMRARDIKAVVDQLKLAPVLLVGWSLGVPEVIAYADQFGTDTLKGLVLVDGRAGDDFVLERTPGFLRLVDAYQRDRVAVTSEFVRSMYKTPQTEAYLSRITASALRTPTNTAVTLLMGLLTADFRPALAKIDKPTLICTAGHAADHAMKLEMQKQIAGAKLETFDQAGHALFVDEPERFNKLVDELLSRR